MPEVWVLVALYVLGLGYARSNTYVWVYCLERQATYQVPRMREVVLDDVGEGRINLRTLPRPVLDGHGRTKKMVGLVRGWDWFARRASDVKLLHTTYKFDFSLNF
jgi:hypothetical protein